MYIIVIISIKRDKKPRTLSDHPWTFLGPSWDGPRNSGLLRMAPTSKKYIFGLWLQWKSRSYKGCWIPKWKLGVIKLHFLELTLKKISCGKKMTCTFLCTIIKAFYNYYGCNYLWKLPGYPQFSFWISI